jgi:ATP-dependent helicase HrpB
MRRLDGKQAREDREDVLGGETESDFFILMRAFRYAEKSRFDGQRCSRLGINAGAAREAEQLSEQFLAIARDEGLDLESGEVKPGAIQRCVLAGFPDQVAVRLDAGTLRCALVHARRGVLARETAVHNARLLVASEVREIESSEKERQVLLTLATKIEEEWLRELFPESFREETRVEFDPGSRRVIGRRTTLFHDLLLRGEEFAAANDPAAAQLLAREVIAGTCPLKQWDNGVEQWLARVNFVAAEFPELEFPRIDESNLPRRSELQGNQGPAGVADCEVLVEWWSAKGARRIRPGADQTDQRSHRENHLCRRRLGAHDRRPDPGFV